MLAGVSKLMQDINNLSGHFLISLEKERSSFFSDSLIWIIKHSNSGSLGLVVNKVLVKKIDNDFRIKNDTSKTGLEIRDFGPVDRDRLFLVHASKWGGTNSLKIGEEYFLSEYSASNSAISSSSQKFVAGIGYSGWAPKQLESEIAANIWLVAPFDRKIVFDMPDKEKVAAAANSIGIDINLLPKNVGQH